MPKDKANNKLTLEEKYRKKCAKVKELNKKLERFVNKDSSLTLVRIGYLNKLKAANTIYTSLLSSLPCNVYNVTYRYDGGNFTETNVYCHNLFLIKQCLLYKIHDNADIDIYSHEIEIIDVERIWN